MLSKSLRLSEDGRDSRIRDCPRSNKSSKQYIEEAKRSTGCDWEDQEVERKMIFISFS